MAAKQGGEGSGEGHKEAIVPVKLNKHWDLASGGCYA